MNVTNMDQFGPNLDGKKSSTESDHDVVRRWGLDWCKENMVHLVLELQMRYQTEFVRSFDHVTQLDQYWTNI